MMLFILDMAVYLITLLGAMAMLVIAAWKSASYGTLGVTTVLWLVPFTCWGVAYLHWHAYALGTTYARHCAEVFSQCSVRLKDLVTNLIVSVSRAMRLVPAQVVALQQMVMALILGGGLKPAYAHSQVSGSRYRSIEVTLIA